METLDSTDVRNQLKIVAIGASAGGVEALVQLFAAMPGDLGIAFVIAMHLPADRTSILPELLKHHTTMAVVTAGDGLPLRPDTIYLLPATGELVISGNHFRIGKPITRHPAGHSIDRFFCSLAETLGNCAMALILSGAGNDATEGATAIKRHGGTVIVQEPGSALYASMPHSAIAAGVANLILPVTDMPAIIDRFAGRPCALPPPGMSLEEVDELRGAILDLVYAATGHDFRCYKAATVQRRIERRMAMNDVNSMTDYLEILRGSPQEADALYQDILIGVTGFFRDSEAFDIMREQVIPQLFADREVDVPVRIWHPCCATGEEVYSVAILIREYLQSQGRDAPVQIFATDLDDGAVAQARTGLYPESIAESVGADRLASWFTRSDGHYQVNKSLREMIVFARHSLLKDPPFSRLDLLVCRNFLIYLDQATQQRLIPLFHQVIKPDGFLFLGSSETVGRYTNLFTPLDRRWKIYTRLEGGSRAAALLPLSGPGPSPLGTGRFLPQVRHEETKPTSDVEKRLLERFVPPCAVVNDRYEAVYLANMTSHFLVKPLGEPSTDILKIVRDELRGPLRIAIHKAINDQQPITFRGIRVVSDERRGSIGITVEPFMTPESSRRMAMVIFEPASHSVDRRDASVPSDQLPEGEFSKEAMIRQLEEQVRIGHEQLLATVEQLETSNEGFMSVNEELITMNEEFQSTNEELQSTNEELETSKEELQTLNEELVTVNAELRYKVEELDRANNDMENLLASSGIASIFLDRDFIIRRFTPAIAAIFNLIPADVGRPFRHMAGRLDWPSFADDARKVFAQGVHIERELSDPEQEAHYLMRLLPYRAHGDSAEGIVVTLIDITERKRMEARSEHLASFPRLNPNPVIELDPSGKVTYFNPTIRKILSGMGLPEDDISPFLPPELHDILGALQKKIRIDNLPGGNDRQPGFR